MLRRVALSAFLIGTTATQPTINAQSPTGGFRFTAHVYYLDGHEVSTWRDFGGSSSRSSLSHQIFTTNSMCVFHSAARALTATDVGYGWTFDLVATTDVNGTPAANVTWVRERDRGQRVGQPSGSSVLSLRPGSSVSLDYITADQNSPRTCGAVGMLLEISRY
jgi:hypothetical protein